MLKVQEYLKSNGLQALVDNYGIDYTSNEDFIKLNYSQIKSPKKDVIADDCRALTLDHNFDLVARSFSRFYNYGEFPELHQYFNWSNCTINSKVDGSLISVFWYKDKWNIHTRGSFATDLIKGVERSFYDLVYDILQNYIPLLNKSYTHIFEYVSPWTQVVRLYKTPALFLLNLYESYNEVPPYNVRIYGYNKGIPTPPVFEFKNVEKVLAYLKHLELTDPSDEGVVAYDGVMRIKLKNDGYRRLHHLKGNNDNLCITRNLVPFILNDTLDDLIPQFPYIEKPAERLRRSIGAEFKQLESLYDQFKNLPTRKDFAISIKDKCSLSGILFKAYNNKVKDLKDLYKENESYIIRWAEKL